MNILFVIILGIILIIIAAEVGAYCATGLPKTTLPLDICLEDFVDHEGTYFYENPSKHSFYWFISKSIQSFSISWYIDGYGSILRWSKAHKQLETYFNKK